MGGKFAKFVLVMRSAHGLLTLHNVIVTCLLAVTVVIGQCLKGGGVCCPCTYLVPLSDSMSSSHSLYIILRIPVGVKDDDGVCGGKIQTQTSSSCRQQETEILQKKCTVNKEMNNNLQLL